MESVKTSTKLPENAYRQLQPGEEYRPLIPDDIVVPEFSVWSVIWGLVYAVIFSMAAAYLGLKIGHVFEAAIPIAILAVGVSVLWKRKNALAENVIIQSIGAASGLIVAGAIFTIPGIYILGLRANFFQIFLASLCGGLLGILFLIPFRKYFVKEMHGEFPFPEATATTEVLVAGEAGGEQAQILAIAAVIGGLYDFCVSALGLWKEVVTTQVFSWGQVLADKIKWLLKINIGAAVTGLGYIIGLRYTLIIASGSFLAWWVLVPVVFFIGQYIPVPILQSTLPIGQMSANQIFADYVRHIGIGGIAAAGIIGVLKSSGIIVGAFGLAGREIFGGKLSQTGPAMARTQKDISMKWVAALILVTVLLILAFFLFGVMHNNLTYALTALGIVLVITFLFTTVSARAIAIVGSNPVSGMTLMTLILTSVILVKIGLVGEAGMLAALLVGGVVCTALSMAGGFITDLKVGYWLGTTPQRQEISKVIGTFVSAAAVGLVILLLYKTYGFGPGGLEAPQASAMAAVLQPLMTGAQAPWLLYLAGVFLAVILNFIGVPPLAFALGMYLPIHLTFPLLVGGLIGYFVTRGKDKELSEKRRERGTLIASGFIAGGAIMGVVAAIILFVGRKFSDDTWSLMRSLGTEKWSASPGAEILGFVMFALLCLYLYWDSRRVKR